MAELAIVLLVAGVWSATRLMRCGRCGVPLGILQASYRGLTLSESCWACRDLEARSPQRPLAPRFTGDPQLARRAAELRRGLGAMVRAQQEELRQAHLALQPGRPGR